MGNVRRTSDFQDQAVPGVGLFTCLTEYRIENDING